MSSLYVASADNRFCSGWIVEFDMPSVGCLLKEAHGQLRKKQPVTARSLIPHLCPLTTFNCCRIHRKHSFATSVPLFLFCVDGAPSCLVHPPSLFFRVLFFFYIEPNSFLTVRHYYDHYYQARRGKDTQWLQFSARYYTSNVCL